MPPSPSSSAPALTPSERLMKLVPERVGKWKRHMLRGAPHDPQMESPRMVEAEFRRDKLHVMLSVTDTGAAAAPPAAPVDRSDDQGSEKVYAEGSATVRETVRRIDGQIEVALQRADGITVLVHAIGVPASDLKALALGIKAAGH